MLQIIRSSSLPNEVSGRCAIAASPVPVAHGPLGHRAEHVADIGFLAATDAVIAARAEKDGSVLVSKDEDFIYARIPDRFILLWLRVGNSTNRALITWLEPRWSSIEALLAAGERLVEVR